MLRVLFSKTARQSQWTRPQRLGQRMAKLRRRARRRRQPIRRVAKAQRRRARRLQPRMQQAPGHRAPRQHQALPRASNPVPQPPSPAPRLKIKTLNRLSSQVLQISSNSRHSNSSSNNNNSSQRFLSFVASTSASY